MAIRLTMLTLLSDLVLHAEQNDSNVKNSCNKVVPAQQNRREESAKHALSAMADTFSYQRTCEGLWLG